MSLYENIRKKKARIKGGSGETMRKKGVKHYFKNGKEHKGATHKDAKGNVMSGKKHTASSKFLVHMSKLSKAAKKVATA
jgi:hypothetical protein